MNKVLFTVDVKPMGTTVDKTLILNHYYIYFFSTFNSYEYFIDEIGNLITCHQKARFKFE